MVGPRIQEDEPKLSDVGSKTSRSLRFFCASLLWRSEQGCSQRAGDDASLVLLPYPYPLCGFVLYANEAGARAPVVGGAAYSGVTFSRLRSDIFLSSRDGQGWR